MLHEAFPYPLEFLSAALHYPLLLATLKLVFKVCNLMTDTVMWCASFLGSSGRCLAHIKKCRWCLPSFIHRWKRTEANITHTLHSYIGIQTSSGPLSPPCYVQSPTNHSAEYSKWGPQAPFQFLWSLVWRFGFRKSVAKSHQVCFEENISRKFK